MDLIKQELRNALLANGQQSQLQEHDPFPVIKLFTPDSAATWLLTELDPNEPDRAFGLCDLGVGSPEMGWVSLVELQGFRGPFGLAVIVDINFKGDRPISVYAREARLAGRILA